MRLALLSTVAVACTFDPSPVGGIVDASSGLPDGAADVTPLRFDAAVDASLSDAPTPDAPIVFEPCPLGGAPAGYVAPTGGTTCYRFFDSTRGWLDAERRCEAEPGHTHLAVITSIDEVSAVRQLAAGNTVWIGLSDRVLEGSFFWVTNTPTVFTNWEMGEPNDSGTEDCGEMSSDGAWNDHECLSSTLRRYVCESDDLDGESVRY